MQCTNCGNTNPTLLGHIDKTADLITSDAQMLRVEKAWRFFCNQCGCIFALFLPPDMLRQYFSSQYSLSASVQNNIIVDEERVLSRRDKLFPLLFGTLDKIGPDKRVLEIACGTGDLLIAIKERYPSWECIGIDPGLPEKHIQQHKHKIQLTREFFDEQPLEDASADVIIAHGLINRVPTLPALQRISQIAMPGAMVSLTGITLEKAEFSPFVWDHTHLFSLASLEQYMQYMGFTITRVTDCTSTWHFMLEKTAPAGDIKGFSASDPAQGYKLFHGHQSYWDTCIHRTEKILQEHAGNFMLFGAGVYNAVLLSLIDKSRICYVIDEVKAGENFYGLPVKSLEEVSHAPQKVLLCCRPAYEEILRHKLQKHGISCLSLMRDMI